MPFKSKSQLGHCFANQIKTKGKTTWDCEEFLKETPNPTCLPYKLGAFEGRCRKLSSDEKGISGVYFGPRGGAYIMAKGVKVYIPPGEKNVEWVIAKYGLASEKKSTNKKSQRK